VAINHKALIQAPRVFGLSGYRGQVMLLRDKACTLLESPFHPPMRSTSSQYPTLRKVLSRPSNAVTAQAILVANWPLVETTIATHLKYCQAEGLSFTEYLKRKGGLK